MFRLIKLAVYVTLGYFAYEFVVGILNSKAMEPQQPEIAPPAPAAEEPPHEAISGGGEGAPVAVRAAGGGRRTRKVGRGVVS
jgi:hypothetical protein